MPIACLNHVSSMISKQGQTVDCFGKDRSGQVTYQFNQQGFRGISDFDFVLDYAFFGCSLAFGIGVAEEQTFAYLFDSSQNYALAGTYDNHDIMMTIEQFLASDVYSPATRIAVFWHSRDAKCLEEFYLKLQDHNIIHLYCGTPLPYQNCYAVPPNLDYDVSGTHYGPQSHKLLWKMLCKLFQQ